MNILISACLLGIRCRYDGESKPLTCLNELNRAHVLVPICPEVLGGLPTPRVPAERQGERVITRDGCDVTDAYHQGAEEALRIARATGCACALLKERSPSCGCGKIYDGSFTGALSDGDGVCAALLKEHGMKVLGESRAEELLK